MIVARITDGLGNQLFQYATARRLALRHDTALGLDLSYYRPVARERREWAALHSITGSPRTLQLQHFTCDIREVRPSMVARFLLGHPAATTPPLPPGPYVPAARAPWEVACRWITERRRIAGLSPRYVEETSRAFQPGVLDLPSDCYLRGYWESPLYFADIRDVLCREIIPRVPVSADYRQILSHILSSESVSIHVRGGDNLRPYAQRIWGSLSPDYYRRCVDFVTARVARPHFFIFSDSHEWAASRLSLPSADSTWVQGNDEDHAFADLWLMSRCRHHILANSTFSWWGAWLSAAEDAVVCTPDPWFRLPDIDTSCLLPPAWHRVQA